MTHFNNLFDKEFFLSEINYLVDMFKFWYKQCRQEIQPPSPHENDDHVDRKAEMESQGRSVMKYEQITKGQS